MYRLVGRFAENLNFVKLIFINQWFMVVHTLDPLFLGNSDGCGKY